MTAPKWLEWVRRLNSIAQAGFTYNENDYDQERYQQIQDIATEIAASHTDLPESKIADFYKNEKGYATPKLDARGAVFNADGEILMVKEAKVGRWTLPGGWVDVWDTPSKAVEREVFEESGYRVKAIKLMAVYDRDNQGHPEHEFAIWKNYFLCELTGGTAQDQHRNLRMSAFSRKIICRNSIPGASSRNICITFLNITAIHHYQLILINHISRQASVPVR